MQVLECGGPGGTGNQVAAICNGLDPAAFDSILVYAVRPGHCPEAYRTAAHGARAAYHVPDMVREISPGRDIQAWLRLYAIMRKERPDVVHAHSSKAGVLARLAALLAGVARIFYSPHGYGFLQADRSRLARLLYRASEWSVSWIGHIVAVSPNEAALAQGLSWGKTVYTVCDPYLGPAAPPPLQPHSGLVVGACGRMTAARNPEAFVRLAAELCRRLPEARCVWIGAGEKEPEVLRLAQQLSLGDRFKITGWLDPAAALEHMRGLDVFVHYSRWDALPNAVLEAMALGLPVVASDAFGNRDVVTPETTGILAPDETGLLAGVLRLLGDSRLRQRFGAAASQRILSDFSPTSAIASLQALYKQN
jgi:glycosyltransferase involved in cell wall biosynthesis